MGWAPQVWPCTAPIQQMAGGRCTVQLFLALALPGQGASTPPPPLAAGASGAKKRGTCRPPSFSHLHTLSCCLPTGLSSVAHHPRPTTRLSLVAIGFGACL